MALDVQHVILLLQNFTFFAKAYKCHDMPLHSDFKNQPAETPMWRKGAHGCAYEGLRLCNACGTSERRCQAKAAQVGSFL